MKFIRLILAFSVLLVATFLEAKTFSRDKINFPLTNVKVSEALKFFFVYYLCTILQVRKATKLVLKSDVYK